MTIARKVLGSSGLLNNLVVSFSAGFSSVSIYFAALASGVVRREPLLSMFEYGWWGGGRAAKAFFPWTVNADVVAFGLDDHQFFLWLAYPICGGFWLCGTVFFVIQVARFIMAGGERIFR